MPPIQIGQALFFGFGQYFLDSGVESTVIFWTNNLFTAVKRNSKVTQRYGYTGRRCVIFWFFGLTWAVGSESRRCDLHVAATCTLMSTRASRFESEKLAGTPSQFISRLPLRTNLRHWHSGSRDR